MSNRNDRRGSSRLIAGAILFGVAACTSERSTEAPVFIETGIPVSAMGPADAVFCTDCIVDPINVITERLPSTSKLEFLGGPSAVLVVQSVGGSGLAGYVRLNGKQLIDLSDLSIVGAPSRARRVVSLNARNSLQIALTGSPGSSILLWLLKCNTPALYVASPVGVVGSPPNDSLATGCGDLVKYSYTTQATFSNLRVLLNGQTIPAQGSIVVSARDILAAVADEPIAPLPPAAAPLVSALRSALVSTDKRGAFAMLVQEMAVYAELNGGAPSPPLKKVLADALDPVADSAALAVLNAAIAGTEFDVGVSALTSLRSMNTTVSHTSRQQPATQLASPAGATQPTTVYFVNGIWTSSVDVAAQATLLDRVVQKDAALPSAKTRFIYNQSGTDGSTFAGQVSCMLERSATVPLGLGPASWFRSHYQQPANCGRVIGGLSDLLQSARQLASIWPTTRDAQTAANIIAVRRSQGDQVIVVSHSQGNLVVREALYSLTTVTPAHRSQLGVIALATPTSGWNPTDLPAFACLTVRGDVIDLVGNCTSPTLTNSLTSEIDAFNSRVSSLPPLTGSVVFNLPSNANSVALHSFDRSYLDPFSGAGGSRLALAQELRRQHSVISLSAGTPLPALYPLDGSATDTSGNNLHGTVIGASSTTDRFGNPNSAMSFDGVNDEIRLPATSTNGAASGTISLWLRTADLSAQYNLFAKATGPATYPLRAQFGGGLPIDTWCFIVNAVDCFTPTNTFVPPDANYSFTGWHMYTFTWSPSGLSLYRDASLIRTIAGSWTAPTTGELILSPPSALGQERLHGAIDDVQIYPRALTQSEIAQLRGSQAFLQVHYPFDGNANDNTADPINGSITNATFVAGRVGSGSALRFAGGASYMLAPVSLGSKLAFRTRDQYTVTLWLRADQLPLGPSNWLAYTMGRNEFSSAIQLQPNGTTLAGVCTPTEFCYSAYGPTSAVTVGQWYHLAQVYDGATQSMRIYFNGAPAGSVSFAFSPRAVDQTFIVGGTPLDLTNGLRGSVDDVRVYSGILSDASIALLANIP